ncbi:MAG: ABC transporter ATP-binding protein [Hyphomicrobiales bacterium]
MLLSHAENAGSAPDNSGLGLDTVRLEDVEKTYGEEDASVRALDPISFSLRVGETTSIVGPSGCGKSTLLRIIAGIEAPSAGKVVHAGGPSSGRMGIVFQRDLLLDWRNVLDNVLLPAEIQGLEIAPARERADKLLSELGLGGFFLKQPWELSGGMRQRVAIARALLPHPALLLLDEPFSSLDAITRDQMNVLLQRVQQVEKATTLLITHSIAEAVFMSERVIVMSGRPGRLLDEIAVEFPRPRPLSLREEPPFTEIVRRIRVHFEQAGVLLA